MKPSTIRKAVHAGSWYDANPKKLQEELSDYLAQADKTLPSDAKLKALIGPHAGLAYSGPNAGWAYKNINPANYNRVVLMGPSHKVYLDFVAQTACSEWATPLGNIQVDTETVSKLAQSSQA